MSESHDITNLDLQDRIANNTDFAVATIAERDAIQTWRRKWGMLVVVFADSLPVNNQMYVLRPVNADLGDNSNWSAAESPAWGLAGNAGTNPAAHFIGTTDNQPVVVRVNNVERARFLSTGFDLVGQIRLVQDSLVSIRFDTTSQAWGARNWAVVNSNQTFGDFCIIQSNALGGDPLVDGTIRQYFDIFGNIGINTLFPEARLDVNGTVIVRDSLKLMAQATDANHAVRADRAISAGAGLSGGGDLTANITISHADTSSQASVDNSNGFVIQDITLDTYGHITGLGSVNLDSRYYTETEIDSLLGNYVTLNTTQTITGLKTFTSGIIGSDIARIIAPGGAVFRTVDQHVTGAIRITLPASTFNNSCMMAMKVVVYNYLANTSRIFHVGGYTWRDGPRWVNTFATQESDVGVGDMNVRFGRDATNWYIYIGETNSNWLYPQVMVTEFLGGFAGASSDYATGWDIDFVTSFATVTSTIPARTDVKISGNQTITGNKIFTAALSLDTQATAAVHAVRASRLINAGTGLSGGGDLTADRTLSVVFGATAGTVAQGNDSRIINGQTAFGWGNHAGLYRPVTWVPSWNDVTGKPTTLSGYGITDAVPNTRTVTAGAGLSGGGDLTANRSLAVVYGATANSAVQGNVAINIAAGLNMTGGGQLTLGAGGTIPVAVSANPAFDSINLGGIVRNTWPAGAPGGDATQIQYNRAGEFAGALFYYDETASIIYRFDTTPTGRQTILGVQNGSVTQFSVMSDGTIQTGNDSPAFKIHKFSPTPTGGIIHINIHNTNYTFEVIL